MVEFLTADEVAGLLKMNQQTIRNYIDPGVLPAVRIGERRVRIRRSVLEVIAAGETGGLREVATAEEPQAAAPDAPGMTGLPADERERLAAALAESTAALDGDDREQLARSRRPG
jgi:excisionase family DNA binding protein